MIGTNCNMDDENGLLHNVIKELIIINLDPTHDRGFPI
jgi:hypothetical protein